MTLEKYRLSLAVLRETRMEIVDSSRKKSLQARQQSSDVVNILSSYILQYKAADAQLTRETLQHLDKETIFTRK